MRLVANWRGFWRWYSVWALALAGAVPVVWMELPADLKAFLPASWRPWVLAIVALAGILGRLSDQERGRR